jgi:uncharacterized Zn finger protein (UPF0148 family)
MGFVKHSEGKVSKVHSSLKEGLLEAAAAELRCPECGEFLSVLPENGTIICAACGHGTPIAADAGRA